MDLVDLHGFVDLKDLAGFAWILDGLDYHGLGGFAWIVWICIDWLD
jgi:hypothetical protein